MVVVCAARGFWAIVVCLWIEAIILIRENATRAPPEKPAQMQKQRRVHCIANLLGVHCDRLVLVFGI